MLAAALAAFAVRPAGATPYPTCEVDPVVEAFDWRLLPPEKSPSEYIVDSCIGPASNAIDALAQATLDNVALHAGTVSSKEANKSTFDAVAKTTKLYAETAALVAAAELYMAKCTASGLWDWRCRQASGKRSAT